MVAPDATSGSEGSELAGSATLPPFDGGATHFQRLGLPVAWTLDRRTLDDAYQTRAVTVHPDRFVTAASAEQRLAMEHASALNEAYAVLRDAVRRAEYLVKLAGVDLDSSDAKGGAPQPGPAFLMEMIERREALAEHVSRGTLDAFRDTVDDEQDEALDAGIAALAAGDVGTAAHALVRRRYLARLLEEIEAELS